jgi:hypothetical protein
MVRTAGNGLSGSYTDTSELPPAMAANSPWPCTGARRVLSAIQRAASKASAEKASVEWVAEDASWKWVRTSGRAEAVGGATAADDRNRIS